MNTTLEHLREQATHADLLVELVLVLVSVALGAWLTRKGGRMVERENQAWGAWGVGREVFFPFLTAALLSLSHFFLLRAGVALHYFLLPIAAWFFWTLTLVRFIAKVLYDNFPSSAVVRSFVRGISVFVWCAALTFMLDAVQDVSSLLDGIGFQVGKHQFSLGSLLAGGVYAVLALLIALWVSSVLDRRVFQRQIADTSLQKIASSATKALAITVGLLAAFSAVGVDLTAFSVIGGAIGLGLGFGLQKLASNYVSGFVILFERSVRIGDHVLVADFEGQVTDIKARYTQLRTSAGREAVIPNEMLVANKVENLSRVPERQLQSISLSLAYGCDLALAERLMLQAVQEHPRVQPTMPLRVLLLNFGPHGPVLRADYWLKEGPNDAVQVRSQISRSILAALQTHGLPIVPMVVLAATQ